MSERPFSRPPLDNVRWASVDQAEVVDPSSGLKDAGYPDSAIPANEEHNSQWHRQFLREQYAEIVTPRVFETLAQAIDEGPAGIAPGEVFRILGFSPGSDLLVAAGDSLGNILGGVLVDIATDGQRIFWASSGDQVFANPSIGGAAAAWGPVIPDPAKVNIALEADGLNLYLSTSGPKVFLLNPATGATLQTISLLGAVGDIAANGVHLAIVDTAGKTVLVYTTLGGGAPTLVGATPTHGGVAVRAVAIDHDQGYIAGRKGTNDNHVHAFDLLSPASPFLWGRIIPHFVTGSTEITDIKADGEFVYVCGSFGADRDDVWALRRADGGIVWSARTPLGAVRLAIDDRYVWVGGSGGIRSVAIDKSSGQTVWENGLFGTTFVPMAADGYVCVGVEGGGGAIHSRAKGDLVAQFVKVENTDPKRRPFPRVALPLGQRSKGAAKQRFDFIDLFEENFGGNGVEAFTGAFVSFFTGGPLTFGPVEAGDYLIRWSYKWQHTNQSGEFRGRCVVDGGNVNVQLHEEEASDIGATIRQLSSGSGVVSLTAATHTIDLEVATQTPGTARMFEALVSIFRIR